MGRDPQAPFAWAVVVGTATPVSLVMWIVLVVVHRVLPDGVEVAVGGFGDFSAAVRARGEDVYRVAVAAAGSWVQVEHCITGPAGVVGSFLSEVGVAPAPSAEELAELRDWLEGVHCA